MCSTTPFLKPKYPQIIKELKNVNAFHGGERPMTLKILPAQVPRRGRTPRSAPWATPCALRPGVGDVPAVCCWACAAAWWTRGT